MAEKRNGGEEEWGKSGYRRGKRRTKRSGKRFKEEGKVRDRVQKGVTGNSREEASAK